MKKPTDIRINANFHDEQELAERRARKLQDSHLHVFSVWASLGDPTAPNQPGACWLVPLALLTDGVRGFLVLAAEWREEDLDVIDEVSAFLRSCSPNAQPGREFVVQTGAMYPVHLGDIWRERTLDLTTPSGVRARLEAAYERAFPLFTPVDHDGFLANLKPSAAVQNEEDLRLFYAEFEPSYEEIRYDVA